MSAGPGDPAPSEAAGSTSGAWRGSVWTPEEDQIILEVVSQEGPKWTRVLQRLPWRTIPSIRNRWQRMENGRKIRESGVESRNRCHACGLPRRGHVCLAKLASGSPRPSASPPSSSLSAADAAAVPMHPAQLAAAQQRRSLEARSSEVPTGRQPRPAVPRRPASRPSASAASSASTPLGGLHALAAVSAHQLNGLSPPSPPPSAPPSVSAASTAHGEASHGDAAELPPPLAPPPPLPQLISPSSVAPPAAFDNTTRKRGRDEASAAAALAGLFPGGGCS